MTGIFPSLSAGGVVTRTSDGACTPSAFVENAYCPGEGFTMDCDATFLPSDCTAFLTPAQINAIASELLCLAETMAPEGLWNCSGLCNLGSAFSTFMTGTSAFSLNALLQSHICAMPPLPVDATPQNFIICGSDGGLHPIPYFGPFDPSALQGEIAALETRMDGAEQAISDLEAASHPAATLATANDALTINSLAAQDFELAVNVSVDAGNAVEIRADGLYAQALLPPQEILITGVGVQPVVLPSDRDAIIILRSAGATIEPQLPDGNFPGQKVEILFSSLSTGLAAQTPQPIRHVNDRLHIADDFGRISSNANPYRISVGEGISLTWMRQDGGAIYCWRSEGSHQGLRRGEQLVFAGCPLQGATVGVGIQRIPMQVLYDPFGHWNPGTIQYDSPTTWKLRIVTALSGVNGPMPFTRHYIQNGVYNPLPVPSGTNLGYSFTGFYDQWSNAIGQHQRTLQLFNNSGADYLFDPALLFVERGYWRFHIYRTVTLGG